MGTIKRSLTLIAMLAAFILVGAATLVWKTGYSIPEMDWNSDGETSLSEMWIAIDVGRRPTKQDGMDCQEYFNLKDGLPIRVYCPGSAANG